MLLCTHQYVQGIVDRLLGEQLPDSGWNCEAENGSTHSSFNTTICVLEALLEHELSTGKSSKVTAARVPRRAVATYLRSPLFPRVDYLFGQDRMVAGSVTAGGFGFTEVVREADLTVGGREMVTAGKL